MHLQEDKETELWQGFIASPIGELQVICSATGVLRIGFELEDAAAKATEVANKLTGFWSESNEVNPHYQTLSQQLSEYFAGRRQSFTVAIDHQLSRGFYREVQESMLKIEFGKTASYQQLATMAGSPKAVRAVGSACATNPLPILLPCHRVTKSDGSIGNYGGGVQVKEFLLKLEGYIS